LVGTKEFFSLPFQVTRDVLIPRPETEHLVVAVLDLLKSQQEKNQLDAGDTAAAEGITPASPASKEISLPAHIADLGTGSGCIAITLAKHLPKATITAVDRSQAALEVAQRNAQTHGVADRIDFRQSDWLATFDNQPDARWDIIVSNPPYISQSEFEKLNKSVRDFEPTGALVSGPEGTEDIRRLAEQASKHLVPGGYLLVELSPMIAPQIEAILSTAPWSYVRTIKDLAHLARIAVARYQPDATSSG
jgi:release factor glutamine methyltransferase